MTDDSKNKVPGIWLEFDFHVHTPASFDFEGIGKDEAGYIWLLEQAKSSNLNIIVATDHNDIAGYFKLREIENDLRSTKRIMERNNALIPETILSQINLFEQITVLPGVELDIDPNIHFIVVFDPQRDDEISTFLSIAGYTSDVRGNEKSSTYCKWSVIDLLQEAEKIDAIVIAAHVDSDKGLYEASKKWGHSRVSAFCDENLYGMEFTNPVSRDQIENIMKVPPYNRKTRLAFVQSSDFHGHPEQKIGERRTYIRMDGIDRHDKAGIFQGLKRALRNPDEFVSAPGRPELQVILKRISEQPFVENLDNENDRKRLIQYICALANTEDGTIVIGKNSKGNWVGQVENGEQELINKVKTLIDAEIIPQPNFTLQAYPYYGNKYIATIRVKKKAQICSLKENDRVYLLENGQPKQASTKEIAEIVESHFIERYSHLSITDKLSEMSQKLLGAEDSIDILPLVRKVDKNSILLKAALKSPKMGEIVTDDLIMNEIQIAGNGYASGDIIVLSKEMPRLPTQYLRVSAPLGICKPESENKQLLEMKKFSGNKIIVAPGGSVYFDSNDNIIVGCFLFSPLVFSETSENYHVSLKFITAYLKSSIAIWYAERCLGSYDIRKSLIQNMPLPNQVSPEFQDKVEKILDTILDKENKFLEAESNLLKEFDSPESRKNSEFKDKRNGLVENHNIESSNLIGAIDELFYEFFNLQDKEIHMIEQVMKSAGFATFHRHNLDS